MKVRTRRTHYMGASNRDKQSFFTKSKDIMEASFIKSQSLHYKTAANLEATSISKQQQRSNPFNGNHMSLNLADLTKEIFVIKSSQNGNLKQLSFPLDFSSQVNHQVRKLRDQFQGREVNMHKLNQLKHTFIKNNQDRRNLSQYFAKFANQEKKIGKKEMKRIVKQYGYDISEDEAKLIFKLTTGINQDKDQLELADFVQLMTKDNVYFRTLKINARKNNEAKLQKFPQKIHLILRNKFIQLKEPLESTL